MENNENIVHVQNSPNAKYYIDRLFTGFIELKGDRLSGDDPAILAGLAFFHHYPITVIGQMRGRNLLEQTKYNFSMSKPEGYRKIARLMKQAEKFKRIVICFVDTIGAYPGKEAEERGQANAIAQCLMESLYLRTPIISVLIGNGGSGGALAISISDKLFSLEYATLSVISPAAFARLLWKNPAKKYSAAKMLKMNANDLFYLKIVDKVIRNPEEGEHNPEKMCAYLGECLYDAVSELSYIPKNRLVKKRFKKYISYGRKFLLEEISDN